MVAAVIVGLVLLDGFGEQERSPVRDAADYAALGEDEGAGCAGDSGRGMSEEIDGGGQGLVFGEMW